MPDSNLNSSSSSSSQAGTGTDPDSLDRRDSDSQERSEQARLEATIRRREQAHAELEVERLKLLLRIDVMHLNRLSIDTTMRRLEAMASYANQTQGIKAVFTRGHVRRFVWRPEVEQARLASPDPEVAAQAARVHALSKADPEHEVLVYASRLIALPQGNWQYMIFITNLDMNQEDMTPKLQPNANTHRCC